MRLLLAEDNQVTRRTLEAALARMGHEVTPVADGAAALAAFAESPAPLVILDWEMPVMDGLEAARRIRAAAGTRPIFVLMLTGRQGEGDLINALNAGVDDYLVKPATLERLEARLIIAERRITQEAARRNAEEALAHARWLAGIGETALALQHEINNPLTALLGETQLLEMDTDTASPLGESVAAIAKAGRRIAALVQRLADLKEPRTVDYSPDARMIDLSAAGKAKK